MASDFSEISLDFRSRPVAPSCLWFLSLGTEYWIGANQASLGSYRPRCSKALISVCFVIIYRVHRLVTLWCALYWITLMMREVQGLPEVSVNLSNNASRAFQRKILTLLSSGGPTFDWAGKRLLLGTDDMQVAALQEHWFSGYGRLQSVS